MEDEEKVIDTSIIDKVEEQVEKQEEKPVPSYADAIKEIKQSYEEKLTSLKLQQQKELNERDKVIKQLLDGSNTAVTETFVDKINSKRIFKKW